MSHPLTDQEFAAKADEALESLQRGLMDLADREGFEVELQGGVLNIFFEEPAETRFVVSPNAPVRQIWVSALASSSPGRPSAAPSNWMAKPSQPSSSASSTFTWGRSPGKEAWPFSRAAGC
jgi:frataxin-like iron-binding protein CyaY